MIFAKVVLILIQAFLVLAVFGTGGAFDKYHNKSDLKGQKFAAGFFTVTWAFTVLLSCVLAIL